jgi:hypothetical protein
MIIAVLSDMYRNRFIFFLIPVAIAIAGYVILLAVHNNTHLEYAACFMVASGIFTALPIVLGWFANNRKFAVLFNESSDNVHLVAGHLRRSVGIAWQVGFANSGVQTCNPAIDTDDVCKLAVSSLHSRSSLTALRSLRPAIRFVLALSLYPSWQARFIS